MPAMEAFKFRHRLHINLSLIRKRLALRRWITHEADSVFAWTIVMPYFILLLNEENGIHREDRIFSSRPAASYNAPHNINAAL